MDERPHNSDTCACASCSDTRYAKYTKSYEDTLEDRGFVTVRKFDPFKKAWYNERIRLRSHEQGEGLAKIIDLNEWRLANGR